MTVPAGWKPALRIVLMYVTGAMAWIILSDLYLAVRFNTAWGEVLGHVAKGAAFVGVTSVLLACLVRRDTVRADAQLDVERRLRLEVQEANALLLSVIDALPDAVVARFSEGRRCVRNAAAGRLWPDTLRVDAAGTWPAAAAGVEAIAGPGATIDDGDLLATEASHEAQDYELRRHSIRLPDGQRVGDLLIGRSVRSTRLAMQAMRETEGQYRMLFDSNPHPMWVFNRSDQRFLAVNRAACEAYGYSASEMLALNLLDIRPPSEAARLREYMAAHQDPAPDEIRRAGVWVHRHRDGHLLEVDISSSAIVFEGRPARLVLARDVTDERRNQARLRDYRRRLSELARQLMHNEHEVALRLSRTLHDGVGHDLVRALMLLDSVNPCAATTKDVAACDAALQATQALIRGSLSVVRDLLAGLRTDLLEEQGLLRALEDLAHRASMPSRQIDVLVEADGPMVSDRLPDEVEYALYMIAREALMNAVKHASPSLVRICLQASRDMVVLAVIDDGVGLDLEAIPNEPGHVGVHGMTERAEGVGARLRLVSLPGEGTRVEVAWPRGGRG